MENMSYANNFFKTINNIGLTDLDASITIEKVESFKDDKGFGWLITPTEKKINPFKIYLDEIANPEINKKLVESEEPLTISEKLYCVLEDLKDYNQNRCDSEIEFIIAQLEEIKEEVDNNGSINNN